MTDFDYDAYYGKDLDDTLDRYIDVEEQGLNALCQKLDRILSGKPALRVESQSARSVGFVEIAATEGNKVIVNHNTIKAMSDGSMTDRMVTMLAVNIHELGHVNYTGHWQNEVWNRKRKERQYSGADHINFMLNLLEDQRQELLLGVRYPKARDWQRIALVKMIKKWGTSESSFILFYGRRHLLPRKLIQKLEADHIARWGVTPTNRAKQIITEFQSLLPLDDISLLRMWELAEEMAQLFGRPPHMSNHNLCTAQKKSGPAEKAKEQRETSKQASEALEEFDKSEEQDNEQDNESEGDDSEGEGPGQEGQAPAENKPEEPDKTTEELLEEFSEKITERLQDEIEDNLDALHETIANGIGGGDSGSEVPIDTEYLIDAVKLSRLFREITWDLNSKVHRQLKSGRLDIRRLSSALASNSNRLFKKRQPDLTNEARMAIAIMIDASGSMGGRIGVAARAGFSVAKGAELAGHMVQIESFQATTKVVKSWRSKKYAGTILTGGGTEPYMGMAKKVRELEQIGLAENITQKVLIMATDGGWGRPDQCNFVLKRLMRMGVHCYIIGIGMGYHRAQESGVPVVHANTVEELYPAMQEILRKLEIQITQDIKRRMV